MLGKIARQVTLARILLELEPRDDEGLLLFLGLVLVSALSFFPLFVARFRDLRIRIREIQQQPRLVGREPKAVDALRKVRDLPGFAKGHERQLPQLARIRPVGKEIERLAVLRPVRVRGTRARSGYGPGRAARNRYDVDLLVKHVGDELAIPRNHRPLRRLDRLEVLEGQVPRRGRLCRRSFLGAGGERSEREQCYPHRDGRKVSVHCLRSPFPG